MSVGADVCEFLSGRALDLLHRDVEDHVLVGEGVVSVEARGGLVHPDDQQRDLGAARILPGHHVADIHIRWELGLLNLEDTLLIALSEGVIAGDGHGLARTLFEPVDGGFEGGKELAGAVQVPHGPDPARRVQRIPLAVGEIEVEGHETSLTDVLHALDGLADGLFVVVVIVTSTTTAVAATAGLGLTEGTATVTEIELDHVADRRCIFFVVNGDFDLLKTCKRALAHTAGEQDLDVVLLEQHHRSHATAVLVGDVLQRCDLTDGPVRHRHESENTAVPKMLGNDGVQTTGFFRRNGNQHTNPLSRPVMVLLGPRSVESARNRRATIGIGAGRIRHSMGRGIHPGGRFGILKRGVSHRSMEDVMGGISDVRVDLAKNRLYITISGFFRQADVPGSMQKLENALTEVQPGFDTVTDLSSFVPGAPGASDALAMGGVMIKERGRRRGVRITGGVMAGLLQFQRLLKGVFDEENTRYAKSLAEADSILDNWEKEG